MKKTKDIKLLTIILFLSTAIIIALFLNISSMQNVNGVNGEVGILKADGSTVPFKLGQTIFSTVKVNGILLTSNDYLYWRFWLSLRATGDISNVHATEVHFKLTQELNGPNSWQAGTEGTSTGIPVTNPSESWFIVNLPINSVVIVPLKYRDVWWGGGAETSSSLLPYTTVVGGVPVREARVEKASAFSNWAAGTYVWTMYCQVVSVTWRYDEAGMGTKTATVTPNPSVISYTLTVVVGEAGSLSVTLTGQGM